jgi:rSAM/selenodomain-associated transferase 2
MSRPPLSIIIPTLNAMPRLTDCLTALVPGLSSGLVREAIVVDGASTDHSADLAADMGCRVLRLEQRGRGKQLRAGADSATGDWLLFLHADTILDERWLEAVSQHISQNTPSAGYFKLAFDQSGSGPRRVANLANWRAKALGLPYGDQGLLISRALYDAVGGYRDMLLMEDVDLVRRIGKKRLVELSARACTSGAKFVRGGWWAVPMRNILLLCAYLLGVKPATLAGWYK